MASSISIRPSPSYLSFSLPLQHPLRPPDSIRRNGRPLFMRPSASAAGLLLLDQSEASKPNRLKSPYLDHLLPPLIKDHEEQPTFEAVLASEALITGEEAVIAAAAAEAIALAKAAVEVAQDAVRIAYTIPTSKMEKTDYLLLEAEVLQFERPLLTDSEPLTTASNSTPIGNQLVEENASVKESINSSPTDSELELLRMQLSESIAVRSARQTERRARRERAAKKVASNVIPVKPASSTRRKRSIIQAVDYSDPLRYLRETTSTSKLLTATEELELSEGIQDLLKLERLREEVTDRCGEQPTISQWAAAAGIDQKTLRERLNYGIHCRDKIIKSNIRLVISIAKNYQGAGMSLQDLVQEGCRGLLKGAEKFDGSKGFKFSTYAHWWIKQAVRRSLSDQSRTIRLPFHMVDATYRVREARKQLYDENRRQPDNEEVAEVAGLSMKRLTAVLLTPKAPRSLDRKIGIDNSLKPSEVIADPDAETAEEMLMKQFMKKDLEKVLDSLNPREKQVVRWRFGLEDGRMRTLQEIGGLMGVSRERVRQLESCAFRKLRNKRRTKGLRQYLIP